MSKSIFDSSAWEYTPSKIAICVPTRDTVHTPFAYALSELVKVSTKAGLDIFQFFESSSVLLNQREKLVKKALQLDAEYILWLDSDMYVPPTTLLRLLAHDKDIVACNYMTRAEPFKSVAFTDIGDWDSWIPIRKSDTLQQVSAIGMGCVLMKTRVFKQLKQPYFEFTWNEKDNNWLGEDFNLFKKISKLGYEVWVDNNLSTEIKHIGQFAFGDNLRANRIKRNVHS